MPNESENDTIFQTNMVEIYTLFRTKIDQKP